MMKEIFVAILLTVTATIVASAQPVIGTGGVLNAASNAFQGLPNSAIAQGSIFLVYGTALGPAAPSGKLATYATFPLQKVLPAPSGTSVQVTVSSGTVDCLMLYTLPTQVAALLPSNTPVGNWTITLSYNGQTSAPAPITVVANSVGLFTANQQGSGPAVVQNFITASQQPYNSLTQPANVGQVLTIWATGLGPVTFDETVAAQAGPVGAPDFEVDVAGKPAKVTYHGRSTCCSGLDQIDVIVPAGVDGCYVPLVVKDGGVWSNYTTISVAAKGQQVCSDDTGFSASDLQIIASKGNLKLGVVALSHSTTQTATSGGLTEISYTTGAPKRTVGMAAAARLKALTTVDNADAIFYQYDAGVLQSQGVNRIPSVESCIVYTAKGESAPGDSYKPKGLDAGPLVEVVGPGGTVQLPKSSQFPGLYSNGTAALPAGFVGEGSYSADNGTGGLDLKGFKVSATFGMPLTWKEQATIQTVNRSQGVTVNWTGGTPGDLVEITGSSFALDPTTFAFLSSAYFVCLAHAEDLTFTVTPATLGALPASTSTPVPGLGLGSLGVSSFSFTRFTNTDTSIGGLNDLYFIETSVNEATVTYQ